MIVINRGQTFDTKFIFVSEGQIYDPTEKSTPVDIVFSIVRGDVRGGPVIDGPFSYLRDNSDISQKVSITREGSGQFTFSYTVPDQFREGVYSVLANTLDDFGPLVIATPFQVKQPLNPMTPVVISNNSSTVINYRPTYKDLDRGNTNTICLIGHADIELNNPIKIGSIQNAVDLLGGDIRSPLLRGVFDAYSAGARDIFVMAAAPMSEFVEYYADRLESSNIFTIQQATPTSQTFYERYYARLMNTYTILKQLDYLDYIVPLEASIIKTGGVDFITQLAAYLADFHNETGFVQLGVIGSRTGGIKSSDIDEIKNTPVLVNKLTQFVGNEISSDIGRFVIPVYGEGVYQHNQLTISYTSSMAATFAGMFSSMELNIGMIRTRLPGVTSLYGNDLTHQEMMELDSIGINTIYRGRKTRRGTPNEVYATNEFTLANPESTLTKAAQMRLVAGLISKIKALASEAIGKFGYDRVFERVTGLLEGLKLNQTIIDYSFNVEISPEGRGNLIFYIELLCALGLKKIDFSVAAGPEA